MNKIIYKTSAFIFCAVVLFGGVSSVAAKVRAPGLAQVESFLSQFTGAIKDFLFPFNGIDNQQEYPDSDFETDENNGAIGRGGVDLSYLPCDGDEYLKKYPGFPCWPIDPPPPPPLPKKAGFMEACGTVAGTVCDKGFKCQIHSYLPDFKNSGICIYDSDSGIEWGGTVNDSGTVSCGVGTREELVNGKKQCVASCGGGGGGGGSGIGCGAQFGACPVNKTCVRNCGGPVSYLGDPDVGYGCLSSVEKEIKERYGCPKCLSSSSRIDMPNGAINITQLKIGNIVWTQNVRGKKIIAPILKISKVPVRNHQVVHLVLTDGRFLDVSASHPTANGNIVGDLKAGDQYDGSVVQSVGVKSYAGSATYDLLPAGDTGYYWANGILMGSTLK